MNGDDRGAVPPLNLGSTTSRGGAPKGNRNRLKHGLYSSEAKRRHAEARMLLQAVNAALALLARHQAEITPPRRVSRAAPEAPAFP